METSPVIAFCCNCAQPLTEQEWNRVIEIQQMDQVWAMWIRRSTGSTPEQVTDYIELCTQVPVCLKCWANHTWEEKQGFMFTHIGALIQERTTERTP